MSIGYILSRIVGIYTFIVIVNVILSWAIMMTQNYQVRQIYWWTNRLTDPVLSPLRRVLSPYTRGIGLDFSPFILIILLQVLQRMLLYG